jgi:hypothetical protein
MIEMLQIQIDRPHTLEEADSDLIYRDEACRLLRPRGVVRPVAKLGGTVSPARRQRVRVKNDLIQGMRHKIYRLEISKWKTEYNVVVFNSEDDVCDCLDQCLFIPCWGAAYERCAPSLPVASAQAVLHCASVGTLIPHKSKVKARRPRYSSFCCRYIPECHSSLGLTWWFMNSLPRPHIAFCTSEVYLDQQTSHSVKKRCDQPGLCYADSDSSRALRSMPAPSSVRR